MGDSDCEDSRMDEDARQAGHFENDQRGTVEEAEKHRCAGNQCLHEGKYNIAIREYSKALKLAGADNLSFRSQLLCQRSSAYTVYCKELRAIPAEASERMAVLADDPLYLAQLALRDAEHACKLSPDSPEAWLAKGDALYQSELYEDAEKAYLEGLAVELEHPLLLQGLTEVRRTLQGRGGGRHRSVERRLDDFDCVLCMKLLFQPVTTPCGHTFCRGCLAQALGGEARSRPACPMCRTVLHVGRELPVSITLNKIITKSFPDEWRQRQEELLGRVDTGEDASAEQATLPLFVLMPMLPGETMALNIFEPRYRLMIRRCMEGNRRLGMAEMRDHGVPGASAEQLETVACECEITDCQLQPDGRYHVEIQGKQRFRVGEMRDVDGYRVSQVQYFLDEPVEHGSDSEHRLQNLVREVSDLADGFISRVQEVSGRGRLAINSALQKLGPKPRLDHYEAFSFWVALLAQQSRAQKREYLQMNSTARRLEHLHARLLELTARNTVSCRTM